MSDPRDDEMQLVLRVVSVLLWRELQRDKGMEIDETTRRLHGDLLREARNAVGKEKP